MTRPLAESVYVAGRFYAAGDVPAAEHAELITNPRAWGDPVETDRPSRRDRVAVKLDLDDTFTGGMANAKAAADQLGEALDAREELFDPSADGVGVDDVNNHLANADDDEVARVLAAEAAGKKRKGILEGPYSDDG